MISASVTVTRWMSCVYKRLNGSTSCLGWTGDSRRPKKHMGPRPTAREIRCGLCDLLNTSLSSSTLLRLLSHYVAMLLHNRHREIRTWLLCRQQKHRKMKSRDCARENCCCYCRTLSISTTDSPRVIDAVMTVT